MKQLFVIALAAFLLHGYWTDRAIEPGPGMVAPFEPLQHDMRGAPDFDFRGFTVTPLASFRAEARVLSAKRYDHDRAAELSPIDLALGWGPMSDSANLEGIDISQRGRFYFWETRKPRIPLTDISLHSANMHLIPADENVLAALDGVRRGHVVRFEGELIRAVAPDGWRWQSSLTRRDIGGGACEVILVRRLELIDPTTRS